MQRHLLVRVATSLRTSSVKHLSYMSLGPTRVMSSGSLVKLPQIVGQLVQSSGIETGKESPEILASLGTVSSLSSEDLKELDKTLSSRTYLAGNEPTAADVALYGVLHPIISALPPDGIYAFPSILRYFDHIQKIPSVQHASTFPLLIFDLENAPKPIRVPETPKEKKKAKETQPTGGTAHTQAVPTAENAVQASVRPATSGKKEKEKKVAKEPTAPPSSVKKEKVPIQPAGGGDAGEPVPSMIDLRVGKIVQVERHPDADGLYVEQIDIGEETPRTVVSGLVHYIPIEHMRNRTIIVVANLKPANMRGIKSFAMVLCASSKDGKEGGIEFVEPPLGSLPGERVYFEGEKYENALPVSQLNPKKKIFETIQPGFITLDDRTAAWIDPVTKSAHKIRTKGGYCAPRTLVGASLS